MPPILTRTENRDFMPPFFIMELHGKVAMIETFVGVVMGSNNTVHSKVLVVRQQVITCVK